MTFHYNPTLPPCSLLISVVFSGIHVFVQAINFRDMLGSFSSHTITLTETTDKPN